MKHFYRDIPGIGNLALSRDLITEEQVERALLHPTEADYHDGPNHLVREGNGVRLIIVVRPTPFKGASLVKTMMRVQPQAKVK